jgi:RNA polymerase sigma-70 factor, ECF subfamily
LEAVKPMSLGMEKISRVPVAGADLSPAHDFASVLAAARSGADWAWRAIYRDLAPSVLGYLHAQGAPDPEDLAGEVFLQVVRDVARFEGDDPAFRAWVLTIAHYRLVDRRRYVARRPVEPITDEIIVKKGPAGHGEDDGLEALANARVRELVGRLPEGQRAVLLLRILGGLTIEQVAQAVGKRPGAVKAVQRRALACLRKELSREGVTL